MDVPIKHVSASDALDDTILKNKVQIIANNSFIDCNSLHVFAVHKTDSTEIKQCVMQLSLVSVRTNTSCSLFTFYH